jgi:hypothetical protein
MRGVRALLVLLLVAGCSHSAVVVSNANPLAVSSAVNASGAVAAAAVIGTAAIAASQGIGNPQAVPDMAPEREVSLQDCTKPVDLTAGNLRCR